MNNLLWIKHKNRIIALCTMTFEEYIKKIEETQVDIYDKEELKKGDPNNDYAPFPSFIMIAGEHFGEKVYSPILKQYNTLIGIESTFEDYYYILKDSECKIFCDTCVNPIKYNYVEKEENRGEN